MPTTRYRGSGRCAISLRVSLTMPVCYPLRMLEPYSPLFEAEEAVRHACETQEHLARFKSQVRIAIDSIQATLVESKKLMVAAKAVLDRPV